MPDTSLSVTKTVLGQLPSMKNGRKIAHFQKKGGPLRQAVIKSQEAQDYVTGFLWQVRPPKETYLGPVKLEADIYFRNQACDLDESLLMDCLQVGTAKNPGSKLIGNDNQIKEKHVRWHFDDVKPRVVFRLTAYLANDVNDLPLIRA
jgi:hypothetical protein